MLAVFALVCSTAAPEACREVMLPAPAPCAAPESVAAEWIEAFPEPMVLDRAECREAADPLPFEEVADGVFVHEGAVALPDGENLGDVSNMTLVVGDAAAALIDSGGSRAVGERALAAVADLTDRPVRHVILGHMHPDHIFGARVFAEAGAKVIGHANLPDALANRAANYRDSMVREIGAEGFLGSAAPPIDVTVGGPQTIDLGGRVLRLMPMQTAHTDNDLAVLDPATGTLIASDLVFLDHIPTLDGSLPGWLAALDDLADLDAVRVVPGHGPVAAFPDGLRPTRDYLSALARDVRAEIAAGVSLSDAAPRIAESQRGDWALFDAYNIRNATAGYVELEWE